MTFLFSSPLSLLRCYHCVPIPGSLKHPLQIIILFLFLNYYEAEKKKTKSEVMQTWKTSQNNIVDYFIRRTEQKSAG